MEAKKDNKEDEWEDFSDASEKKKEDDDWEDTSNDHDIQIP